MDFFIYIILLFALITLIIIPFIVLFHGLGHAIPAILMTREKTSIYIGSNGDPQKSFHFNIGLLEIWLNYNPLLWRFGKCVPTANEITIDKQIIYTLTGPLASFLIAIIACYFTFVYDLHGSIKLILVIFFCSSIIDLLINLVPRTTPMKLYDGSYVYNDGYRLKQLFAYKWFLKEYDQAIELYKEQKFDEVVSILPNYKFKKGLRDEHIYKLTIATFLQLKNYKQVNELAEKFMIYDKMDSNDYFNVGFSYSKLDQHDKALEFYEKSLLLNPDNKYSLDNKAFTFNLLNRFEEAILLFDKSIEIDEKYAYSYSNRGLSKIKIGKIEEGLEDINYSFKLDEKNSYNYRSLGIYYLDKGEYFQALELFQKAKELDNSTYMIDKLIVDTKEHI
ncbi:MULTISPECIES: tetratricopeptide repeat protein [unclassified Arcicella]|uniref:tetratricopeptide repeat protein n=1 Tax=unclassified Arcicella TaxID=2644986 RepID=UPI002855072C|nr:MULTISPECIES: tetratricopeptide repeat protein [unclassified Arcicella]MDR6562854.1 tetratricopeptide (TPR) repeat protein [Arcicella sp. BE51]MDR6812805.1 tetratricopeptide (TPR) repeat protein [Arcicella sp. BE140]MDR6824117.1 tetratricopeptide (TPR) repeat protein [Arcicella sp. BE139]